MIADLDEVLRQVLIRELPIKNGEVDVTFDQPKREWSARINRPTLNLFLHDLSENTKLRQTRPPWEVKSAGNGKVSQLRRPVRVDLNYIVTAWANEPEDEHRLLARTLMVFFRLPNLPEDLLPESLQDQPVPIPLEVAQSSALPNAADIWSVLDNEIRPAIAMIVTLAMNPYQPVTSPLVRTRELQFGQTTGLPSVPVVTETNGRFWTIGGQIKSDKPLEEIDLRLVERAEAVRVQTSGRFVVGSLEPGNYTLEIAVKGRKPRRHKITVPSPDYEIEV